MVEIKPGYDRITDIINYFSLPEYVKWVGKVGNREAKRAGTVAMRIGTEVDEWIKADIGGIKLPKLKSDESRNCVEGYKLWKKEFNPELKVGTRVYNDDIMVTGEPDLLDGSTVIDIKCSLVIRPIYWLQTEFYARETCRYRKAILRLDKHLGTYEYDVAVVDDNAMLTIAGLVTAYRWFKQSLTEGREEEDVTDTNSTNTETGSKEGMA